jgi:hypothetical protein
MKTSASGAGTARGSAASPLRSSTGATRVADAAPGQRRGTKRLRDEHFLRG